MVLNFAIDRLVTRSIESPSTVTPSCQCCGVRSQDSGLRRLSELIGSSDQGRSIGCRFTDNFSDSLSMFFLVPVLTDENFR